MSNILDFIKEKTGVDHGESLGSRLGSLVDTVGKPIVQAGKKIAHAIETPEAPAKIISSYKPPDLGKLPVEMPDMSVHSSTPAINQKPITGIHQLEAQTLHDFPFDDIAKGKFKDIKFSDPKNPKFVGSTDNMHLDDIEGEQRAPGAHAYDLARKFLPESIASWVADRAKNIGLDNGSITVDPEGHDPAEQVLSHEMLHHLYDKSPMGQESDTQSSAKAGTAFLHAWDAEKDSQDKQVGGRDDDSVLHYVDTHVDNSGYDLGDPYSIATERYAYLGQEALKYGIDVIPEALRPYYYGVIKGAPKPTDEQLGANIDPEQGFNIKIGGADDYVSAKTDPVHTETPDAHPIVHKLADLAKRGVGYIAKNATEEVQHLLGKDKSPIVYIDDKDPSTWPPDYKPKGTAEAKGLTPAAAKAKGLYEDAKRKVKVSDEDIATLRSVLYGEVSNRTPEKQKLEARVILNTMLNRASAKGNSLSEVATAPNQYQAYDPDNKRVYKSTKGRVKESQYNIARSGKGSKTKMAAIDEIIQELKDGRLTDNTNNAKYYIHNDDGSITYDDLRAY